MPSLINNPNNLPGNAVARNYRKTSPSTRFGTPELVHAVITINNNDVTDINVVDGYFYNAINIIQKFGEIYAIGNPSYGGGNTQFTVILKASTVTDPTCNLAGDDYRETNLGARTLSQDLEYWFESTVNVSYTVMWGGGYD